MSFWDDLFSGGQQQAYQHLSDLTQQGMGARQNYFNQAAQAMQPYSKAGLSGLGQYQHYLDDFGKGINSNEWMKSYQESPYAHYQTQEALKAADHAAAASGMLGSGAHQAQNMQLAQNVASHDMQNYFNNLMNQHSLYQNGLSNLTNLGASAANQFGNFAFGTGAGIANDYGNQGAALANQSMANANMLNNFAGMGLQGLAMLGGFL